MTVATSWFTVLTSLTTGAEPLLGKGLALVSKSSKFIFGATDLVVEECASIGPALNASDNSVELEPGQIGLLPARANVAIAVRKDAIPPCFG